MCWLSECLRPAPPRDRLNSHPYAQGKGTSFDSEMLMSCGGEKDRGADGVPGQLFWLLPERTGRREHWIIYRGTDAEAPPEPSGQERPGLRVDAVFRSE